MHFLNARLYFQDKIVVNLLFKASKETFTGARLHPPSSFPPSQDSFGSSNG